MCSLSATGRESQKLNLHLSGQIVRLITVGSGCTLHLAGCLEHDQDEPEAESSDEDMWGSDRCADARFLTSLLRFETESVLIWPRLFWLILRVCGFYLL